MTFLERASAAIRAAGGRMTDQRQTIIALLADAPERIDAATLYRLARARDPRINLATVYRTLEALEAAQVIRAQFVSPDHERRYFTRVREAYHFTCRRCRRVIPFESALIDRLLRELAAEYDVQPFSACICVEGLCPDCREAAQEEEI
jgi:Fur family ferric uptake transcriptional regulator